MGRSGFTDEGGASMMSWLHDSASCTSSQQKWYDAAFQDPAYLRYLEGDLPRNAVEAEAEVAALEEKLLQEKRKNKS
ncbi:hypothetical protein BRADI_4g03296v3 [Brachypodium distachyon]|uniref:Uncharacterized protein n=1 Tax=Brachypodium distachyon TaxID=15368 RepID=I1IH20_BRADI|nr:hypothetical protein BRADI_4g03296v3 [Brachypodium distachyon]KQJ86100.1 hypothetical protein BRADI_4g03296v3 [Brachypodium distachyon]